MPNPVLAVGGLTAGAGLIGASKNAKAIGEASDIEAQAAADGIAEQRRQFDAAQELLKPFVEGGTDAFTRLLDLSGVNGNEAMSAAISGIEADPRLAYAMDASEDALLARASATGGLRGGNTARALAELRPQLLSGFIDQTMGQLGGIASMGQSSAAGQAATGMQFANNTSQLLANGASARAGGVTGGAAAFNQGLGGIGQGLGFIASNMPMSAPSGAGLFDSWGF